MVAVTVVGIAAVCCTQLVDHEQRRELYRDIEL